MNRRPFLITDSNAPSPLLSYAGASGGYAISLVLRRVQVPVSTGVSPFMVVYGPDMTAPLVPKVPDVTVPVMDVV